MSRGRTAEDMLKGLEKHELEKGKEALEEMEKIVYLSKMEKHLLNEIIKKLGIINLESEIQDLKNQTFTSPQQQAENQAKIAKKQKELEEFKKNAEKKQGFVKQEISTIKNQIHQSLQKNNLKTSDLPPQYQNWEEQLEKCESKEQIEALVEEINEQIKQLLQTNQNTQQPQSGKNFPTGWVVGSGLLAVVGLLTILIIRKKKERTV